MVLSALVLALAVVCVHGKAQGGYDFVRHDPLPEKPSNSYGGGDRNRIPPPLDVPKNSYGSKSIPEERKMLSLDVPKSTDFGTGKIGANNYGSGDSHLPSLDVPEGIDSGVCKTTDLWTGVVGCYDCEMNKCAKECQPELPKNFEMCYNKTALFNLKALFLSCLGNDYSKCHRLTDDMALAFLLAHYDQRILDINRKDECIFRCGRPRVMNCMNMCDPLTPGSDIQKEPIVACYKSLESKIHAMLVDFAACLK